MVGSWPDPIPQLIDETDFMESHVWRTTDFDALDRLHDGRVALAGDAAHAFLTFTSQGVSAALEDAEALAECFAEHFERDGVAKVFEAYDARRRPGLQKMVDDGRELARRFLYPERYLDGRKLPLVYEPPDDA